MVLAGALRTIWAESKMKQPLDQDTGIAHCHYIRQLAWEIWMKENINLTGKRTDWKDAIRAALALHVKKLRTKNIRITKITPVKPITAGYCGWGW